MRQFMSNNAVPAKFPTKPVTDKLATECSDCGGASGVREAGQEDISSSNKTASEEPVQSAEQQEKSTVVMSGPLGAAVTEALNKALKKTTAGVNIGAEGFYNHVQANGQIYKPGEFISRTTKSVGLVPKTDEAPTPVNVMLDAVSRVDQVEFIMVQSVEPPVAQSIMPQKSILHAPGLEALADSEGLAVESVQLVVKVRKIK